MNRGQAVTWLLAIVILLLWGGTWYFLGKMPLEERGTFGDMFGAVNALFSGFAFLGVIYAILLQKNELSLQRQELELTRQELRKSADAQEKSEKALSTQAKAMERTALINLLTTSIESLNARIRGISLSGESSVVEKNKERRAVLQRKSSALTKKLDSLIDEAIDS